MLSDYQIFALSQIWPVLFVPLFATALYWFTSRTKICSRRILISAHGVLLLASFSYALTVSPVTGYEKTQYWIWPFWFLLALSVISIFYTFFRFEGNRWVHLIQLLVIPSVLYIWLVGTMTITHDWL